MELIVRKEKVYGRELIYPVCEKSKGLARIAGKKTFTPYEIVIIKSLGYKITLQAQTI